MSTMWEDDRWADARRVEGWAGEVRVNLIRLAAVVLLYGHHLLNVYAFRDDPGITPRYHGTVTAVTMAWATLVLGLYFCLSRRWVPPGLKYAATLADTLLVTALLALTEDPRSWLAILYFL